MAEKKYGHFDDANREYVITDPQTPWPWINYLGNEDFFSLISNTAGGYSFYKDAKFTHYVDKAIDLKQVVNTNKCLVHVDKYGDKLLITSCIDNLLKGAVGQAVQNMNIMFGLDQTAGLKLKPSAF